MKEVFPVRLKALRTVSGKTQEEIANLLNIKRSTYGEYERGKITPPVEKIKQLADILKTTPQYLLGWDKVLSSDMNMKKSAISTELEKLRLERNKTIKNVMDGTDIPEELILQYEKGFLKVPNVALKKLANYFEVDSANLIIINNDAGLDLDFDRHMKLIRHTSKWLKEFSDPHFDDEEMDELINYAKYLISKRGKKEDE